MTGEEIIVQMQSTSLKELVLVYYYFLTCCKKLKGENFFREIEDTPKNILRDFFDKYIDLRNKFGITSDEIYKNYDYIAQKKLRAANKKPELTAPKRKPLVSDAELDKQRQEVKK